MNPSRPPRRRSARQIQNTAPKPSQQPPQAQKAERLQKLLAGAGLGSRREIEAWIEAGRVAISGQTARLGDRASPSDVITVDGKPVALRDRPAGRVLMYHKPIGELVTRSDPQGRPTVFNRLPQGRWVAVGRLDINSSGLLLLTDDGELANRLMHPRYEVERVYDARVQGRLSPETLEKLRRGIDIGDGVVAAFTSLAPTRQSEGINRWYRVALKEGRNREVRRLFEAVGGRVSKLVRVRYGPVELPRDLAPGQWREVSNTVKLQKLCSAD